jgi:hypothetical protein
LNTSVTPYVLAGRIVAIIGMGFTAAAAILLLIILLVGGGVAGGLFPFLAMIVLVERYSARHGLIGPESPPES